MAKCIHILGRPLQESECTFLVAKIVRCLVQLQKIEGYNLPRGESEDEKGVVGKCVNDIRYD